jgi:hypothetical protein
VAVVVRPDKAQNKVRVDVIKVIRGETDDVCSLATTFPSQLMRVA